MHSDHNLVIASLEPQCETPAEQSRIANVGSAEDRFEVVKKQLVRQVLHIELDVY
jgi:hypothetical protein